MLPSAESQVRSLLREAFDRRQAKNPSFSLRAFSRKLRIPVSAVSEILAGKRPITAHMGGRILASLDISTVRSARLVRRLSRQNGPSKDEFSLLQMDQYQAIAEWYCFAILSLAETRDFDPDPEWIAQRLGITRRKVRSALRSLLRLGLLRMDKNRIVPTGKQFATSRDVSNELLRKSHAQMLVLAQNSLDEDSVDRRDISGITMAIDPELLPEAKAMIRKFRRELCSFLESSEKKEVYRLSLQLFPLTQGESV